MPVYSEMTVFVGPLYAPDGLPSFTCTRDVSGLPPGELVEATLVFNGVAQVSWQHHQRKTSTDGDQSLVFHFTIHDVRGHFGKWVSELTSAVCPVVKLSRTGPERVLPPVSGVTPPEIAVPPLKLSFHHMVMTFRQHLGENH